MSHYDFYYDCGQYHIYVIIIITIANRILWAEHFLNFICVCIYIYIHNSTLSGSCSEDFIRVCVCNMLW